jgi:4-alpha-glucanotransferase
MGLPDPSAWGVLESYEDHRGDSHRAPDATIARILEAMGAERERPPSPTVRVITRDQTFHSETAVGIELEDGGRERTVHGRLPLGLPYGYHRLLHKDGSASRLILSPGMCFLPSHLSVWGWAVQLYSARSRESWGIGDLHDLADLGRWARAQGAGAILINPLGAVAPGLPQQASPYSPSSRCFLNPLYLRIEDVPGAAVLSDSEGRRAQALNSDPLIARDAVYAAKMEALEALWKGFQGTRAFDDYRAARGDLLRNFATHTVITESYGWDRSSWPPGLERADSAETKQWQRGNEAGIAFHEWMQWLLDRQLGAAAQEISLIHDLPVGVDPTGADAWMWQDVFARGMGIGAPPDELSIEGQGWGLAPFDPWKLRGAEYEPFIQTVRAALRHGAGLRIDHVMGLFRLYWIPGGMRSSAGTYVRYPASDLLNIVALESHRAAAYIIGEDLGTVEAEVRTEMGRRNLLSYRVMWFEEGAPSTYPRLSLATVTNHDLPTIAGLWTGADLEEQRQVLASPNAAGAHSMRERLREVLGCSDDAPVDTVIEGAYALLARGPSMVAMATVEDALAVTRRPNIPGTTDERPNWSMSLPLSIEQMRTDARLLQIARTLSSRARSDRL